MGNWRTVTIVGTCDARDVPALRKALHTPADYRGDLHPLMCGGLAGLPNWAGTDIHVTGNLAERDYSIEDVATTLLTLVDAAPSLRLKVHCGGDYEDRTCHATINVADKAVTVDYPEVATVEEVSPAEMKRRMLAWMRDGGPS